MKKILWVGEFTELNTGYSNYGRELLTRLYKMGKFDIYEMASYCAAGDVRIKNIPWKVIPIVPINPEEHEVWKRSPQNQWGAAALEGVLLKIKPDVVMSIRDFWMCDFITSSPYRDKFFYIFMPTVDSSPSQETWLASTIDADAILTYSEYGRDALLKETGGRVKFRGLAPAAVDYNIFKPVKDKKEHKKKYGLQENISIVGTVMRNQKRKLYPELIEAFKDYTIKYPHESKDAYLLLHTQFPDIGFDIPRLIKESGLSHKTLLSYFCTNCQYTFPAFFRDAVSYCPRCKQLTVRTPGPGAGFTLEQLSNVYNLMDLYVQYAICLGKDEEILTKTGWKKISDVQIGEFAWTHKHRWQKITNKFINQNKNNVKNIHVYCNNQSLIITDNHPVLSIKNNESKMDFRQLKDLKPLDYIAYPIDNSIIDKDRLDLADCEFINSVVYKNHIEIQKGRGHKYPRYIDINNNFCKFIGLYVADGSAYRDGIMITTHSEEIENQTLAYDTLHIITGKKIRHRKYKDRKAVDIAVTSALHLKWFLDNCKKGVNKQLPDWCLHLPLEKQKHILQGLFMGDGYIDYQKYGIVSLYCTISKKLSEQIEFILKRFKIKYTVSLIDRNKYNKSDNVIRKPIYIIRILGDIKEWSNFNRRSQNLYLDDFFLLRIKNIEESNYKEEVYNIEVEEDNSYTTKIGCVHNCEGQGIPMMEAAACGVPIAAVNYSAMESAVKNLNGIPINVGTLFRECESHLKRAYPDNTDFVEKLHKYFQQPEATRLRRGQETYLLCRRFYDYDKVAALWAALIEEAPHCAAKWAAPKRLVNAAYNVPDGLSNDQFVAWCAANIVQHIPLNPYFLLQINRDLNYGQSTRQRMGVFHSEDSMLGNPQMRTYTRDDVLRELKEIVDKYNFWESQR
jgi:intein/homing endonuclease